jgi:hypothetical protein
MDYTPQLGDIALCASTRLSAKIVMFLQQEKTIWHWIYKKIFNKPMNEVKYYHGLMVLNEKEIIEQQWKIQIDSLDKILTRDIIIFRKNNLTDKEKNILYINAIQDLGKTYDILLMFGKTLTFVTGIKWFAKHIQQPDKEFCISAVADWYWQIGIQFGLETKELITTDIMEEYCLKSEEFDVIYINKGA